jgi:hypothetical protein
MSSTAFSLADSLAIPAPPRARSRLAPARPAWREAMIGALAGLGVSVLLGEAVLLLIGF